jgi:hypothetical protein
MAKLSSAHPATDTDSGFQLLAMAKANTLLGVAKNPNSKNRRIELLPSPGNQCPR